MVGWGDDQRGETVQDESASAKCRWAINERVPVIKTRDQSSSPPPNSTHQADHALAPHAQLLVHPARQVE